MNDDIRACERHSRSNIGRLECIRHNGFRARGANNRCFVPAACKPEDVMASRGQTSNDIGTNGAGSAATSTRICILWLTYPTVGSIALHDDQEKQALELR